MDGKAMVEGRCEALAQRFKDASDPLEIVITDKDFTGFTIAIPLD